MVLQPEELENNLLAIYVYDTESNFESFLQTFARSGFCNPTIMTSVLPKPLCIPLSGSASSGRALRVHGWQRGIVASLIIKVSRFICYLLRKR